MDINNIKLFSKVELIQRLKQSGFGDVAVILQDKELDGKKFTELTEFETFKWKLSPAQKRCLWNCVEDVKTKPSLLAVKQKPKPPKSVSFKEPRPVPSKTGDLCSFKGSLESILGSNTRNASFRKPIAPPKTAGISHDTSIGQRSNNPDVQQREMVHSIRKSPLPLPKQDADYLAGYIEMHAPKQVKNQGESEDYLTPNELEENDYESPPVIVNKNGHFSRTINVEKNDSAHGRNDRKSPVPISSNNVQQMVVGNNKRHMNLVDHTQETLSVRSDKHKEEEGNIYEPPPPPLKAKVNIKSKAAKPTQSPNFANHVYTNTQVNTKPSIKDLGNVIIIDEKDAGQETPVFSKITNTLSSIFKKNKLRTLYENHIPINNAQEEDITIPVIRNRALPSIPSEDQEVVEQKPVPSNSIFEKPFPVPRQIATPSKRHSYITVISPEKVPESNAEDNEEETYENVKGRNKAIDKVLERQLLGTKLKEDYLQAYENKSSDDTTNITHLNHQKNLIKASSRAPQMVTKEDEEDQVYENTSKPDKKLVNRLTGIQHNSLLKLPALNVRAASEDEEETYENTGKPNKLVVDSNEEHEIYENTEAPKKTNLTSKFKGIGNDSSYVTLTRDLNDKVPEKRKEETKEEEDQIYENTNKPHEKEKFIKGKGAPSVSPRSEKSNTNVPSTQRSQYATDLASLLSRKLKERETRLQNKSETLRDTSCATNIISKKVSDPLSVEESHSNSEDTFSESDTELEKHCTRTKKINQRPLPALPDIPVELPPLPKSMKKSPLLGCAVGGSPSSSLEDILAFGNGEQRARRPQVPNKNTTPNVTKEFGTSRENVARRLGSELSQRRSYERYRLPSEDSPGNRPRDIVTEDSSNNNILLNYRDDPFFRDIRRNSAKTLLRGLSDGAFLFRPGTTYFLVLTLKYRNKFYNLGIEKHGNKIRLNAEGDSVSPEFSSLEEFVYHFTRNPVTFQEHNDVVEILLNPILPPAVP